MAKSRRQKNCTLNLVDVFKCSTKTKQANGRLELLAHYIKNGGNDEPNGWFYKKHFNKNISPEEAFLYMRAVLASYCLQSSEFSRLLARAFIIYGPSKIRMDSDFLSRIFVDVPNPRGPGALQRLHSRVLLDFIDAIDSQDWLIRHLSQNRQQDAGWIINEWFDNLSAKSKGKRHKRFTSLEAKVFRLQVLLIISYECSHHNQPEAGDSHIACLQHAWGEKYNNHKIARDIACFFGDCFKSKGKIITVKNNAEYEKKADIFLPNKQHDVAPCTPLKTRSHVLHSPRTPATPTDDLRERDGRIHLLSTAKKIGTSLKRRFKRRKESSTPINDRHEEEKEEVASDRSAAQLRIDTGWSETSTTSHMPMVDENDGAFNPTLAANGMRRSEFSWSPPAAPSVFDWSSPTPPTNTSRRMHDDLPMRQRGKKFTFNEQEIDRRLDELLVDDKETTKVQDAESVLSTVLHLAAIGSRTVQSTMKSVLVQSMPNDRVTHYLREDGYAQKRIARTLESKQRQNEARRRFAFKHGIQPRLLPEVTSLKYKAPHGRKSARARSQLLYTEYLEKGVDIPAPVRYCNIQAKKIDWLVKWVVDNFQFRPGKTRNVLFKTEGGMRLKDLPIYMRYGSFSSNYDMYCSACPQLLRVGREAFRTILKATTLKGTYNQGLSYYYVDFIDMTKLVIKMLQRLQTILTKDQNINSNNIGAIKRWIDKARQSTDASREYLTHRHYSDIQKDTNDGWCCAAFALGHSGADEEVTFEQNKPLSLALSNSIFLVHATSLVMNAVSDESRETLRDEFLSMFQLAKFSALEMLHYAKHLMRGWWQDNAINETKNLLARFPTLKAVVMDHKNKLLPQSKFEAMSAYFGKHGISILGAMVLWYGKKRIKGTENAGLFVWFIDTIMNNTTSQEARDLMPGIEAIRAELQQQYFRNIGGNTDALCLFSDNALIAASHSAFIHSLNFAAHTIDDAAENSDQGSSLTGETVDGEPTETSNPASTGRLIDAYVAELRDTFAHRIEKWGSCVEPYIIKWLTWEAQRGKTQLDTHFAYLNKQLTKACLQGEIDYLDPQKVFQALSYKGGSRATTTLLLDELEASQTFYDQCDKAISDRKGIKSVHDITWESDRVLLRHYTNLDTGEKIIAPSENWPSYSSDLPMGQVRARFINKDEPVFFPFKSTDDTVEETSKRDPRLLSTRIYNSLMKYSSGMNGPESQIHNDNPQNARSSALLEERASDIASIREQSTKFLESLGIDMDSLDLNKYWAQKKNRTYLNLSDELHTVLLDMFRKGQGAKNKAVRYTAERAVMELQDTLLQNRWDQRLVVSVGKVKGFFSRKHAAEEKDNDAHRAVLAEAREVKVERGQQLLGENRAAEEAIVCLAGSIDQAALSHFAKLSPKMLKAFIKCRVLVDAASCKLDKMPNKGSLRDAQQQAVCAKTGKPLLIQWAFELRSNAITAKLIDEDNITTDPDLDRILFSAGCANNDAEEAACFESVAADVFNEMESGIVDVEDDQFTSDDEKADDSDDNDDEDGARSSDDDSL